MFTNQKGFAHLFIILILLAGLATGVYLVQKQTSLKSKASLDTTRIEVFGPSVSGDRTTSRNVRIRLVYVPPGTEPSPPPGCHYEDVVCITAPCPKQLICTSPTPQPSCAPPPSCSGQLIHGDPQDGQCPSYFCIIPSPTPNPEIGKPVYKSGVNSFSVEGNCTNGFTTVTYDCYDGFSNIEQAPNGCASSETLQEVARRGCENRSSSNPYTKQTNVKGVSTVYAQTVYPTHFRLANSSSALENAAEQAFNQNSSELDWVLTDGNGLKTIYAQFKVSGTWESPVSATIILDILQTSPSPTTSPSGSSIDPNCQNLLNRIQNAYRTACGDTTYDSISDVNKDRTVNSLDQGEVRQHQTNSQWCQQKLSDLTNPCPQSTPSPVPTPSPTSSTLGAECQRLYSRITASFTKTCGDANYDKVADLNKDRVVDIFDQSQFNSNFSNESWCHDRLLNDIDPCGVTTGASCQDLYIRMRQSYLKTCESSDYNPVADINKDGVVDLFDFSPIRRNISNESWCTDRLADTSSPCINNTTSSGNFIQQFWQNITNLIQ